MPEQDVPWPQSQPTPAEPELPRIRITYKHWFKPISYEELGEAMKSFWSLPRPEAVGRSARPYLVLRKLMELHQGSDLANLPSDLAVCRVSGSYIDNQTFVDFVTAENVNRVYTTKTHLLNMPVTFFQLMLLLNLHSVDSVDDFVQVRSERKSCHAQA